MRASSGLRAKRRSRAPILTFAAAMARGDVAAAVRAARAAHRTGWPRVALEEVSLMLVLHAGYPAALEATRLLARLWPGRPHRTRERGVSDWRRRGRALGRRVYGPVFRKLIANVRSWHPDLAVWMVEQGYGRVLSRAGLEDEDRELVAVTVLAATGWERELVSHLRGAERLGAKSAEVRQALLLGLRRAGPLGRAAGRRAWRSARGD